MSKKKPQKPKAPFKMTPGRSRILHDLHCGARIMVTHDNREGFNPVSYSVE